MKLTYSFGGKIMLKDVLLICAFLYCCNAGNTTKDASGILVALPNACSPPFTNVLGSCYALVNVNGTQEKAIKDCKALGTNITLATIRCQKENDAVLEFAKKDPLEKDRIRCMVRADDMRSFQYRIGLHDIKPGDPASGKWFTTGENKYRNWAEGEPNNSTRRNSTEQESTVEFYVEKVYVGAEPGKWNNLFPSTELWGAICEKITPTSGFGCREGNTTTSKL